VETRAESDGALFGVDLNVAKGLVKIGRDDDVDRLDGAGEGLVKVLLGDLKLEQSTVNLVNDNNRLDALSKGLAKHSLSLDADTLDSVDDDKGTISDTKSSSDLGREVDVAGGVNEVDQEVLACEEISNWPIGRERKLRGGGELYRWTPGQQCP